MLIHYYYTQNTNEESRLQVGYNNADYFKGIIDEVSATLWVGTALNDHWILSVSDSSSGIVIASYISSGSTTCYPIDLNTSINLFIKVFEHATTII